MRTMTAITAIAIACTVVSTSAIAANADICFGPTVNVHDCYTTGCVRTTNTTVFTCPQAGGRTIPQLGAAGWQIVELTTETISVNSTTGDAMTSDRLVIQQQP